MKSISVALICLLLISCKSSNDVASSNTIKVKVSNLDQQNQEANTKSYTIGVTNINHNPLVFRDEKGNHEGFDIDILNAIATANGVIFSYESLPAQSIFTHLNQDRVSIISNEVVTDDSRAKGYLKSRPYLDAYPITIVTKDQAIKTLADLRGKKIAIKSDMSAEQRRILYNINKNNEYEIIETRSDWLAVQHILTGKADAAIGNSAIMPHHVEELREAKLRFSIDENYKKESYVFVVSSKNSELLTLINSGIEKLHSDDAYQNIFKKWF